ncbi:MAG: universal stress protein [Actinomycetes bacterium]
MDRTVVIGFDGSADAQAALAWGLALADRHRAPVRIVCAFDPSTHLLRLVGGTGADAAAELYKQALAQLKLTRDRSKDDHPHLEISSLLEPAAPSDLLIEQSRVAGTVVVGSRGSSRFSTLLAGSTTLSVAGRAHCTVVAVRSRPDEEGPGRGVVVGTDGSPVAEAAVGFAFQQAAELAAPLTVVHAWTEPVTMSGLGGAIPLLHDPEGYASEQQALLAESLAGWADKFPSVAVQARVVRGHPVPALVAASAEAELLVVGCHGGSVIRGMVLGSVSQGLLHRVHLPLAVVHLHD